MATLDASRLVRADRKLGNPCKKHPSSKKLMWVSVPAATGEAASRAIIDPVARAGSKEVVWADWDVGRQALARQRQKAA